MKHRIGALYQSKAKVAGTIVHPRDFVSISRFENLDDIYRTFPARTNGLLLTYKERCIIQRDGWMHDLVKMLIGDKVIWMCYRHIDNAEHITGIPFVEVWRQISE